MKHLMLLAAALFAGGIIPIQGAVNARLGQLLRHPLQATFISFLGGLIGVMLLLACIRPPLPTKDTISGTPLYLYSGGLFGVIFVTTVLMLIPRIGVATMLATAITGQLIVSLVIDHFGWLNVPVAPVTPELCLEASWSSLSSLSGACRCQMRWCE